MAPSELINVREFRDKYAGLVRSQRDHGLFNAQSEWSEEVKNEVAERCCIDDDLCFSNTAFVNPTLFHMLRQHREFNEATERELLQKKREEAAELERRRQDSATEQHGLVSSSDGFSHSNDTRAEASQAGFEGTIDRSMLLSVDVSSGDGELGSHTMDVDATTVEDALARLASGTSATGDVISGQAGQSKDNRRNAGEANSNSAQTEEEHLEGELVEKNGDQPTR
ncbi:hypothetical protein GGI22_006116, partial [Coemansia erecta]